MERGGGRFTCTWGPARGPGGSGTAGAVGMKHGRAMLRGPWCGEQERPLPVLPLIRESAALRAPRFAASEAPVPRVERRSFFPQLRNLWCKLPKQGACFRLEFVHRTEISLSLFRNNIQFRRCTPYFGRKAYGNLRVSFFLEMREE